MSENDDGRGSPFKVFRPDIPSPARMSDYYLGGKDHYPSDREAAQQVIDLMPPGVMRAHAWSNRRFMQRAVRYIAAETEVRQFLDIGTGLPTEGPVGPVHEVAQAVAPESRVVYVDHDLIVVAHAWEMISGVSNAAIVQQDLRNPEDILADKQLREVFDLDLPVAVVLVAIVPFLSDDDDPAGIIRRLMEPLAPGSHLVLSHGTTDAYPEDMTAAVRVYRRATTAAHPRTKAEVRKLLTGLELVEPGLVWLPQWRPDADTGLQDKPEKSSGYGAVARKR